MPARRGRAGGPHVGAPGAPGPRRSRGPVPDRGGEPADRADLQERYIVPGLKRGLEILQLFRKDRPVLRLLDMANEIGLSRSSAFRLAYTLESMGFLERADDGRSYRLASRVLSLGFEYLASVDLVEIARPVLERLRDRTDLSAHLAILEGREIVHLIRVPSRGAMTSNVSVGSRRPAHATPMGRVLLFELSEEQLGKLYRGATLARVTDQTPTTLSALKQVLAADRERGHVVSYGSYVPGGASIAAPVRGPSGAVVAAINISGPQDAFADAVIGRLTEAVLDAAGDISTRLGYKAPHRSGSSRGGRESA